MEFVVVQLYGAFNSCLFASCFEILVSTNIGFEVQVNETQISLSSPFGLTRSVFLESGVQALKP